MGLSPAERRIRDHNEGKVCRGTGGLEGPGGGNGR